MVGCCLRLGMEIPTQTCLRWRMPSRQLWSVILSVAFAIVLTVTPIPANSRPYVVTAAWAFFAASLLGWILSQKKALSPVDKRDALDKLVQRGQRLTREWTAGKRPKLRTRLWSSQVDSFVRSNFSMTLYDQFKNYTPEAGSVFSLAMEKPKAEFPDFDTVISIMGKTQGLQRRIKPEIRD